MGASTGTDKSEWILSQIEKRQAANQDDISAVPKCDLVICMLGEDYYAFKGCHVREILPYETINYVPGCPDTILGIINVRGDIESVLDLSRVMHLKSDPPTIQSRIIIAAHNRICTGILVDRVEDVITVPTEKIKPVITTIAASVKPFAEGGEMLYNGRYVTVLDIKQILQTLVP